MVSEVPQASSPGRLGREVADDAGNGVDAATSDSDEAQADGGGEEEEEEGVDDELIDQFLASLQRPHGGQDQEEEEDEDGDGNDFAASRRAFKDGAGDAMSADGKAPRKSAVGNAVAQQESRSRRNH